MDRRVCRVLPDVPAVDRPFEYLVTDEQAALISVGTIVRVPLQGRRVRGWVIAGDVVPEAPPERLRAIHTVVSAGPSPEVVGLTEWAAWRWAGPRSAFLRAASAPNVVSADEVPEVGVAVFPPVTPPVTIAAGSPRLHCWPPASPRVEVVRSLLASEGTTLVVVPDAVESTVLADAFRRDGRVVVTMRANEPAAARTEAWNEARRGACVVIGGRLAVLAPAPDVVAIVVLDEGDEALKEERAPAWNARELAIERARRARVQLDFVTPAPTPESVAVTAALIRSGRADERRGWPNLEIVDRRDEPPGVGIATNALGPAMHRALDAGTQAVCVLNRRGRAKLLACRSCRALGACERCDAAVGEEKISDTAVGLVCARCGEARPMVCLECGGTRFHAVRPGVGRARDAIAGLVPRAQVVEVDAAKNAVPIGDVLVGTEAVLHRAPDGGSVGLVAFLDFDQELLAPRYRAAEQALWLLVRAARLVGGRSGGGRVLVQTRLPDHEVLVAARDAEPLVVATAEADRRRTLAFPPFGGMAALSGDQRAVEVACDALRAQVDVRGPHEGRALLRAATVDELCNALVSTDLSPARSAGRLRVEVDPLRI